MTINNFNHAVDVYNRRKPLRGVCNLRVSKIDKRKLMPKKDYVYKFMQYHKKDEKRDG